MYIYELLRFTGFEFYNELLQFQLWSRGQQILDESKEVQNET